MSLMSLWTHHPSGKTRAKSKNGTSPEIFRWTYQKNMNETSLFPMLKSWDESLVHIFLESWLEHAGTCKPRLATKHSPYRLGSCVSFSLVLKGLLHPGNQFMIENICIHPQLFFLFKHVESLKHHLPSGKRLHNYGNHHLFMGKSTINGPFSIAMLVYQRGHEARAAVASCLSHFVSLAKAVFLAAKRYGVLLVSDKVHFSRPTTTR